MSLISSSSTLPLGNFTSVARSTSEKIRLTWIVDMLFQFVIKRDATFQVHFSRVYPNSITVGLYRKALSFDS